MVDNAVIAELLIREAETAEGPARNANFAPDAQSRADGVSVLLATRCPSDQTSYMMVRTPLGQRQQPFEERIRRGLPMLAQKSYAETSEIP